MRGIAHKRSVSSPIRMSSMLICNCVPACLVHLQEAANKELDTLRHINKPMYDAVTAMIAQSKELEQLAAGTQPQPQPQAQAQPAEQPQAQQPQVQPQQQQPQQQQPHYQRRLMSVDDSSSSSSDGKLVEPFALGRDSTGPARHLMQAGQAAGGQAAGGGHPATAGGAPAVVPGVEADPNHAALTQEALDSFKVFEDVPADAATTAGDAATQAGGDAATVDATGEAAGDIAGDAAAGGVQDPSAAAALAQEQHHTRATDYDEFGDAWKADMWKQGQGE